MLCFKQKIELPTFSLSVLPSFSDTYDITLSASTGVSCSIAGWSRKHRFFDDIEKTFNARFINWYVIWIQTIMKGNDYQKQIRL